MPFYGVRTVNRSAGYQEGTLGILIRLVLVEI